MNQNTVFRLSAALVLVAGGVILSAQQIPGVPIVPSSPAKQFGGSISPAFEGWFDNADGTHSFLIGYYSRNTQEEIDIPIGPNNHFEPTADMGQPTHFLTRRRFGMFVVTVPKEFGKTQKITWTLSANGTPISVPFYMHTDYNLTPLKSSEESPNREYNHPPVLKFAEAGPTAVGPMATGIKPAMERTATAGTPMPLDVWADDDALYSTGGNAPLTSERPPVTLTVSKFRGPGKVTVATPIKFAATKGGKAMEPYAGKASTTVTFSEPGDYLLHVNANDLSGNGGGGSGCCWTTVIMKVTVTGNPTTGGQ